MQIKGRLIIVAIFSALAASIWYKEFLGDAAKVFPRQGVMTVVVSAVERKSVRWEIEALGTVKSRESVVLTAKVTEKVEQVHFTDGQEIKAGQILISLASDEQKAKVRAAKANLKEQQREHKRIEGLVRRNTIASSELDKLFTDIEVARAVLAQNQAELDARSIHAPFTGLLGFRQISPGALITPGTVITTLDDIARVKLDFSIPESFIGYLKKNTTIEGQVAAFPEYLFSGVVTSIDSRVDPETRTILVRAEIDNQQYQLRPGMLMTIRLIVRERLGLVVPEEALVPRQRDNYLFVVNSEGVVEQRLVKTGFSRRGEIEILTGVEEGELVISRGIQRVRPGQHVETQRSERFTHREVN
ncbi:efflux RND transporter periplasmic adaptor subunit [Photobacterium minamisatsumaniensis]|uniref:efflux RND transporter periplasmic adaptor subunit n=1 Tax=Photobacterium minamisatsumaniensis TaxID=2910233 RepID=UPI003D13FE56